MQNIRAIRGVLAALMLCMTIGQGAAQDSAWYETEPEIIATEGEDVQRRTPRESVRNFVELSEAGRFGDAMYFLNLSDLPEGMRADNGPRLARELATVIDRQVWIDWTDLSARPDAMQEHGTSKSAMAAEPRRDIRLKLAKIDGQAYEIRLARYKAEGIAPVWLFTPQTVDNIPELYRAFGPASFESHIPESFKKHFAGLRLWEWMLLPLMLAALFGLGWATQRTVGWASGKMSRPHLRRALVRSRLALGFVVVSIAAQALLEVGVSFSGPATTILRPFLLIVMVAGIGLTGLKIIDAILDRVTLRVIGDIDDTRSMNQRELYTTIYAVRRVIMLLMVGIATIVVLSRLNLFDSLGVSLLASAGVLTVVLGIAGQAVLGNIMASLQIALAKPMRIGDSVLFEGDWAYVESIYYTFLRLRTWDERRIIVPVKYFVSQPFENWSVKDARMLNTITIFLDHRAEIEPLREAFLELANDDEDVIEHESLLAAVTGHTSEGQEMSFFVMSPDPSTGWFTAMRLREQLLGHIRETHPDWWPQERFLPGRDGGDGAKAAVD